MTVFITQNSDTFYNTNSLGIRPARHESGMDFSGDTAAHSRTKNDDETLRESLLFIYDLVFPSYQRCRGVWYRLRADSAA